MFCVLVKYQDLNMLLVLIKMFRAWFLFLSVEENSTISTTKHLLHMREQMESLVSQMVSRDFAVMDGHFSCSPVEIWAADEGGKARLQKQLPSAVRGGGNGEAPEIQLEGRVTGCGWGRQAKAGGRGKGSISKIMPQQEECLKRQRWEHTEQQILYRMPVTSWNSGTHPKKCSHICLIAVAFIANSVHIYFSLWGERPLL